jgi:hypothetical protein
VRLEVVRVVLDGMRRQPDEEKVIQAGTFALKVMGMLILSCTLLICPGCCF